MEARLPDIDAILTRTLKLPADRLQDDVAYGSTSGWDSLTHIDLMLAIEEAWGVQIDAEQMLELTSVGAIRRFVARMPASP
jgi:citrate synthase